MKALLDVHNVIVRKCLKRHRGYEVKTEGDAFMISFQHATQGLGFSLDVQVSQVLGRDMHR
jgi:adenylate cyclase